MKQKILSRQNKFIFLMITKKEVEHIAKLARLGLADKEIEKYRKELSSILDYIERLKEVDIKNVEPTSHPVRVDNVMREDKVREAKVSDSKFISEIFNLM